MDSTYWINMHHAQYLVVFRNEDFIHSKDKTIFVLLDHAILTLKLKHIHCETTRLFPETQHVLVVFQI